ncbi:hypothetical protein [Aquamicrobium sp. LC103]|uniref:hypothetical protein n=1 Tax=Aquamicrobium sp. LC103 TaxID=1120658 RepID=UPI00063EBEDE|nr:hypothetical protein [Aquamicrobium sp. LC103]TKT69267.1 hypothetical protein XW59_028465 [Aquamicrobium sp. LC103]
MRVENFGTNALSQADPKVKAKESALQAQMENLLATHSNAKPEQAGQGGEAAMEGIQGTQTDEG